MLQGYGRRVGTTPVAHSYHMCHAGRAWRWGTGRLWCIRSAWAASCQVLTPVHAQTHLTDRCRSAGRSRCAKAAWAAAGRCAQPSSSARSPGTTSSWGRSSARALSARSTAASGTARTSPSRRAPVHPCDPCCCPATQMLSQAALPLLPWELERAAVNLNILAGHPSCACPWSNGAGVDFWRQRYARQSCMRYACIGAKDDWGRPYHATPESPLTGPRGTVHPSTCLQACN